jgi:multisubunit Na+/H+ antiporter MnhB subunit
MSTGLLDLFLAASLVGMSLMLLLGADFFRSVVLFIVFGLLMALAWARLNAPDLALAEAIVGAGVTGALLMGAWHRTKDSFRGERWCARSVIPHLLTVCVVAGLLIWAVVTLAAAPQVGLKTEVMTHLAESGVSSPVTAVLLNFRGYDTLLELGVLLLVVVAVQQARATKPGVAAQPGPVLSAFMAIISPVLVVISGYLLWRGSHAPGGAFQAGAMLGAAGILALLVSPSYLNGWRKGRLRALMVVGPLLFLSVAVAAMAGGSLLEFRPDWAGGVILLVEAGATVSIAAALVVLFLGSSTQPDRKEGGEE